MFEVTFLKDSLNYNLSGIEDLNKEGDILIHKKGNTLSLNPTKSREIAEYIKTVTKI